MGNTDICLVSMPYAAIERPSIALGLLKASLQDSCLRATVLYPNLWFAELLGVDLYTVIMSTAPEDLLGEWTFAGAAFPDFEPAHAAFLGNATVKTVFARRLQRLTGDPQAMFWQARHQAEAFIERVTDEVLALAPRIVGCSSTFQQHCASIALLRRIRQRAPQVITLMGGANCEGAMGRVLQQALPWIDYVVSGEADALFRPLCERLIENGRKVPAQELPFGVFGPANQKQLTVGEAPRATMPTLERLPVPDYDEYFHTLHGSPLRAVIEPTLLIETSRGCWWGQKHHCTFCGLNGGGMQYRSKPPQRVVDEFDTLAERYALRKFQVVDNILDMSHLDTVLPVLARRPERYSIFYETKANLRRDQMAQLASAGVRWIQPGLESMHSAVLKLLDKGNTPWMNVQLLKWAVELGIRVGWNLLCRVPGESDAWYAEMACWLPWIAHLEPPAGCGSIRYDRFSPYYERQQQYGLELRAHPAYAYIYPLSPAQQADLAYYFEAVPAGPDPLPSGPRPGLAAVQEWVRRWRMLWYPHYWPELSGAVPPRLVLTDCGDHGHIEDTRPGAPAAALRLDGLAYQIYSVCDQALPTHAVGKQLGRRYGVEVSSEQVLHVLQDLQQRRLVLELDGRLMALATRAPLVPLPRVWESAGGYVENSYMRRMLDRALRRTACLEGVTG